LFGLENGGDLVRELYEAHGGGGHALGGLEDVGVACRCVGYEGLRGL
jgi:hypothetical protein